MNGSTQRSGMLLAVAAYAVWGFNPLYFGLMRELGPVRILAHRAVWSGVLAALFVLWLRRGALRDWWDGPARNRQLRTLALSGAILAGNWGAYIYAATRGHLVQSSLGYFICPLVAVGLGVAFLGERLTRGQKVALTLAAAGVLQLVLRSGTVPGLALFLAASFGLYGLLRKKLELDPLLASSLEAMMIAPPGLIWLALGASDGPLGPGHVPLLVATGAVTFVPLVFYVMAARRLPYSTLGLLQYILPTLHLLCGVIVGGEAVSPAQLLTFALVWAGLAYAAAPSLAIRLRMSRSWV
jgi:chloramphenicol-sensitive protein RarD